MDLSLFFSEILNGLLMGALYGLMAVGIALIFGVMKMINFAHGSLLMLGGYFLYYLVMDFGVNPFLALPIVILVCFAIGVIFEFGILRPMFTEKMDNPKQYAVIITFGAGVLITNLALLFFGITFKRPPEFIDINPTIGMLTINGTRFVAGLIGTLALFLVLVFVRRTWYGKALQATAQNREGTEISGIDSLKMDLLAFGIASSLAGTAGALLAPILSVYPQMGRIPVLKGFVIVVLGGLGSIKGSIIGAIILGLLESMLSFLISPSYRHVYSFVLMMLILIFRPRGLFGEKERKM